MTFRTCRRAAGGLFSTTAILAAPAFAGGILVTSDADGGAGSLRAALEAASAMDAPVTIVVTGGDIALESGLVYEGAAPLTLVGAGQTISTAANETLLSIASGADLTASGLTFRGPGGFSIENRGDTDGAAGKGIFVDVAEGATGTVRVTLVDVTVADTAGHGVHVSDCSLADDCGGGGGGAGDGSAASIEVVLSNVTIDGVGQGSFDADGVRVDERAEGDIRFTAVGSTFTGVGADGVELDEGQAGDVIVSVTGGSFSTNGDYCDPEILGQFMPEEDEGEFEEGQAMPADIPQKPGGTPDDACFEYEVGTYDDGSVEEFEISIDTDDGFDVDEAGPGSIVATLTGTAIDDNLDEGLDYDEEGPGGIDLTLVRTTAMGNSDDAYKNSEADEGGVTGLMVDARANDNGGVGAVFEEEDAGDVTVTVSGTRTSGNDDGETGLEVVQEDEGTGMLHLMGSEIADGIEAEGVETSEM